MAAENAKNEETALGGYRVLDLTDEKGFLCAKILADLGADVIKIEKREGDYSRRLGPFIDDTPHREKSLRWMSFNVNKRGITLDLEDEEGRDTLKTLIKTAHFVIESTDPGYLAGLGLDYAELSRINQSLVMVSITPFGQDGPYKEYKGSDLVCWALGGMLYITGDVDRPPVQVSVPQAYCVAGANAAAAALIAHFYRERTGRGQHVDVSIQACIPWVAQNAPDYWPCFKGILRRGGDGWAIPSELSKKGLRRRIMWPSKDGHICSYLIAGGPAQRMNQALVDWMAEEGITAEGFDTFSWDYIGLRRVKQDYIDKIENSLEKFFLNHSRSELFKEGQKRGAMIYPVSHVGELINNPQLEARNFWVRLESPVQDRTLTYPGPWAKLGSTPCAITRRAPLLGEHNEEIRKELCSPLHTIAEDYQNRKANELKQPFEGLVVVDFSWAVAAPIITKYLAEHGATVIKVESTNESYMDIVRTSPPYVDDKPGRESSGLYLRLCANKLGTTIDMSKPQGLDLVRRLIAKADVIVENFRSGVTKKWGLDYEQIVKIKPDIIILSSTNLGQTGPFSWMAGFGNLLTAYTGFYSLTGWPDRNPVPLPGAYTDYITPPLAAASLIAALDFRRRTGKGQHIDISQMECALQFISFPVVYHAVTGKEWVRKGNRSAYACPHGVFRCKGDDTWCAIAVHSREEWEGFKTALGNPLWTNDDRFSTFSARKANEDSLEKLIEEYTIERSARNVMDQLQAHGVPAGVVQSSRELFEDPQLRFREMYKELNHSVAGRHFIMKEPFIFSTTPSDLHRAAPCLGQDNELICKEILNLSHQEFESLVNEGVLG